MIYDTKAQIMALWNNQIYFLYVHILPYGEGVKYENNMGTGPTMQ